MQNWEYSETKVAEEYCWAITQGAGRGGHAAADQVYGVLNLELRWILSDRDEVDPC